MLITERAQGRSPGLEEVALGEQESGSPDTSGMLEFMPAHLQSFTMGKAHAQGVGLFGKSSSCGVISSQSKWLLETLLPFLLSPKWVFLWPGILQQAFNNTQH